MPKCYAEGEITVEVPFHDIDVMGIAWHGHYAKYLELARTELLNNIDYDIEQMKASGYAWPVIELHIRYARPLNYRQKIRVRARLAEFENRLKINYEISDQQTGRRLTRAHTVQVALDIASGEMLFASPAVLKERLSLL
ncbi:acyl-CoA thioesterase [Pseudohalioglobus sediminis]|uniref:Acyl-CoA thioesterase n=1 Tax=Pseudohalioglobus sediminis TaxID=2606449 RepID=A0A5B0WX73_9GAMM|nr:acyl-CoA thioesterase [Pseudohalioglobus sediminis]KAA1190489.1 acyl-CoA thioesterase [Pseudohalioglobus sediminis]